MAGKVLSIEIGYSYIKICEMDYQAKKPKIYNSFVLKTPDGVLADGVLTVNDSLLGLFRARLAEKGIKTKNVIFTVSSSRIVTREVKIPYCKENRIGDLVRANLSDYFPIDASQYMIAHTILETEKAQDTGKPINYRLLLLAAPNNILEGYRGLAAALGLELKEIDYNGNSIYQAAKEECATGTQMVIKIDERSSLLLVMDDGVITLNRTIPYGIDQAAVALSRTLSWGPLRSYENAMDLALRKTCILPYLSESGRASGVADDSEETFEEGQWEEDSESVLKDKREVTESMVPLINGISKVIDYYNANHRDATIERILITGIGSDFRGTAKLLSNETGYRVRKLKNITNINIERTFKRAAFGEYVACMGAGMAPVHFTSPSPDARRAGRSKAKGDASSEGSIAVGLAICILGAVVGIGLVSYSMLQYTTAKNLNTEYKQIIQDLQPAYLVYQEHQALTANYARITDLNNKTVNRNAELVEFIESLENKMPSTFCLTALTATPEGIVMNATVATKEEVAAVLDELRKLECASYVDTKAVSQIVSDIGEIKYVFATEIIYAPIVFNPEETAEGEE